MNRKKFNEDGFTLTELMVSIAIVGFIASQAIGALSQYKTAARQTEAKTFLKNFQLFTQDAEQAYGCVPQGSDYNPEDTLTNFNDCSCFSGGIGAQRTGSQRRYALRMSAVNLEWAAIAFSSEDGISPTPLSNGKVDAWRIDSEGKLCALYNSINLSGDPTCQPSAPYNGDPGSVPAVVVEP